MRLLDPNLLTSETGKILVGRAAQILLSAQFSIVV
jgi:hypothetical protein